MPDETRSLATIAAHGVRAPSPESLPEGLRSVPAAEPIYQTAVFDFPSIEASLRPLAVEGGYVYARYGLPNARTLESTVAALEGAEDGLATSSGTAAILCAVLAVAGAGDRVLVQRDAYGGTITLLGKDLARLGLTVETVDAYDLAAVERALRGAKLLVAETISNPLARAADLAGLAKLCRAAGTLLVVDNTFATPVVARPLEAGAHAVVHSATKFLGGHHDLCAGVLVGEAAYIDAARGIARRFGMQASPFDSWLASRGIQTLVVRMERAQENAFELARRLRESGRVVHHPAMGAILSFDVGSSAKAEAVVRGLKLITLTPSLGGTGTTLSHAATSSHRGMTPEERRGLGIGDGLLRVSVGIEAVEDLWRDLSSVL
jgi:cystathionine beta-lyase/cystathionine gamma-synthase